MPAWSASPQAKGTVASAVPWMMQTGIVSSERRGAKSYPWYASTLRSSPVE
jgi:hypothetical protein